MFSSLLVQFYRFWHGRLHLKGAGFLLKKMAPLLPGLQAYAVTLKNGSRLILDFRDHTALYWLNFLLGDCYEEEGLIRAIHARLNAESVVWDVGANAGVLSYILATHTPHPKELQLFEPNPKVHAIASSAMEAFPFAQTHPMALSDTTSPSNLVVPKGQSVLETVVPDKTNRRGDSINIVCCKGDDMVFKRHYNPPNIIKIDTEGH